MKKFIYIHINNTFVLAQDYPHLLSNRIEAIELAIDDPRHYSGIPTSNGFMELIDICPNWKDIFVTNIP
jgi:hypothetical protein